MDSRTIDANKDPQVRARPLRRFLLAVGANRIFWDLQKVLNNRNSGSAHETVVVNKRMVLPLHALLRSVDCAVYLCDRVAEERLEDDVGVVPHALLVADNDEL